MNTRAVRAVLLAASLLPRPVSAQKAEKKIEPAAVAVLWKDPGSIAEKDLYWGSGSEERAPQPPFTFTKEDSGGTNPKIDVVDARGTKWNVKFDPGAANKNEVHSEIAATRIVWALGYAVEEMYYVPEGTIEGVKKLGRAASAVGPDGSFRSARFERRSKHMVRTDRSWTYTENPFLNSKELSGLKILTALVNNWDNKNANNRVFRETTESGPAEDWYLISDWGATFGQGANYFLWASAHTRWNLGDYQRQALVGGVKNGRLELHYKGVEAIEPIPLEHARWFAELAGQLELSQVRRAFEAAGASPELAEAFAKRVIERIDELESALKRS